MNHAKTLRPPLVDVVTLRSVQKGAVTRSNILEFTWVAVQRVTLRGRKRS